MPPVLLSELAYTVVLRTWPVVVQRVYARLCRLRVHVPSIRWSNHYGTPAGTLRRALSKDGWAEEAPWSWKHNITSLRLQVAALALGKHRVRAAWKPNMLVKWASGSRREAQQWEADESEIHLICQQIDWEWPRANLNTCNCESRAVLLRSAISPSLVG